MKHWPNPITRERSVEELLFWWPEVIRRASGDWERNFAMSIAGASRRLHWRPTEKQLGIMQRLVSAMFQPARVIEDFDVIE